MDSGKRHGKKGQKGEVTGEENSLVAMGTSCHQHKYHRRHIVCYFLGSLLFRLHGKD